MMPTRSLLWFVTALALLCCAAAPAQGKMFHPEKFERATKTDENGLVQWAEHADGKCPNCTGTGKHKCTTCERYPDEATKCPDCGRNEKREAVCRACAGTGKFPDPLEKVMCPGCMGSGKVVCGFCPGSGILKLGEDAKNWSNCPGCRGDGWAECPLCQGTRLADAAKLKPSLAEASAKDLKKAFEQADKTLVELTAFTPAAKNTRKEVKELERILKTGDKLFPPFKEFPKLVKDLMKTVYASSSYQGQAEREAVAMERVQQGAKYYLQHQRRMLELCLKRAEANEKLLEEQKGK